MTAQRGIPLIRLGEDLVAPLFSSEEELIKVSRTQTTNTKEER